MKQSAEVGGSSGNFRDCRGPFACGNERSLQLSPLCALARSLLASLVCVAASSSNAASKPLPTLTLAHQVHSLTAAEASKGYPIHLRGVVTYYDPYLDNRQIILFIHDASGSMFASVPKASAEFTPAGTFVDLHGTSGMGDFAPIVSQPRLSIIGRSYPLPTNPTPVSLTHLLTGEEDGQWVEVEGVVHSASVDEHDVSLQLSMRDGIISATLLREPGRDYSRLVDAKVRIHANAGPMFNGDHQMIGARLLVPNLSAVTILEPGPKDPFDLPLQEIDTLRKFNPSKTLPRRVHLRGRVTLSWPGSLLCIRDAKHGICARSSQATALELGQRADVAGFTEISDSVPSLDDAVFRAAEGINTGGISPIVPTVVTAEQALRGKFDSELVQIEGRLVSRGLATPGELPDTTLLMASDGLVYAASLPGGMVDAVSQQWKNGSRIRVTGICSVQIDPQRSSREDGAAIRKSFRILIRSSKDVTVLEQPSWWTPPHVVMVLALLLSATLLVLVWVMVLSRRLRRQAEVIGESEERFRHMAQHDYLTGLPTRLLLRDRLDQAINQAKRSHTGLALLMLDLDRFKQINDKLGHPAGDEALKVSAQRLSEAIRRTDTVARISGDEFIVLITNLAEKSEAELVAAKIVAAMSAPFLFGDKEVPLSASVGVCTAFDGELNADTLLKSVDAALYGAKARGRNCYELYTDEMAHSIAHKMQLRLELECALNENEMEVYYQPMVNFKTGELTGFEALLRWHSKTMGMVLPGDFIPLAEETGFIIPLGEWVLREACRQIGQLERQTGRNFMLAVNLSPRQIEQQKDLPQRVALALSEAKRPPYRLELEITENILMHDSTITRATLLQLHEMKVRLAIDDFGTGFASLSYITRFAIDQIKIDRSFIQKCIRESGSLAVVRAMIAMAHGLSMNVVAEGVETETEFRFLRDEGCDTAQGYYLSAPVAADELQTLIGRMGQTGDLSKERAKAVAYTVLAINT